MPEPGTEPPGRSALNARLITRVRRDVDAETAPPFGGAVAVEAPSVPVRSGPDELEALLAFHLDQPASLVFREYSSDVRENPANSGLL